MSAVRNEWEEYQCDIYVMEQLQQLRTLQALGQCPNPRLAGYAAHAHKGPVDVARLRATMAWVRQVLHLSSTTPSTES